MGKNRKSFDEHGVYGFDVPNASVTRVANISGTQILWVETDHATVEIQVSPKGHKINVKALEGQVNFNGIE